jgi:hypothetical protein
MVPRSHQIHSQAVLQDLDVGVPPALLHQDADNLLARHIPRMQNPPLAVPTFLAKVELVGMLRPLSLYLPTLGEMDAPLEQVLDAGRARGDNLPDNILVAQPHPRSERVRDVRFETVALGDDARHPPLRIPGVAFPDVALGDYNDLPVARRLQGGKKPRKTRANHEKITSPPVSVHN